MRKFLLLSFLFCISVPASSQNVDSLLNVLDDKIKNRFVYVEMKEQRIAELKYKRNGLKDFSDEMYLNNAALFEEYKRYISDSAIYYISRNIYIADSLQDGGKLSEAHITLASLFINLGMFLEAKELLEKEQESRLAPDKLCDFYAAYRQLYLGLGIYSQNSKDRSQYWEQAKEFDQKLMALAPKNSEVYLKAEEKALRLKNEFYDALKINDKRLELTAPYSAQYAFVTFHRSLLYRGLNDVLNEKRYLALSAISDARLSINDNASISVLASVLMKEGNLERAYQYIRFSLANIKEYNTRIRSSEILGSLAIIDKAYQMKGEKKRRELKIFFFIVCVLLVLLVVSVFYLYKQMKERHNFNLELKKKNQELELLNTKLSDMNLELNGRNLEVAEANHIKEKYITFFLNECVNYIVKLDNYRITVNKKLQNKQYEKLYDIARDTSLKEKEYEDLFKNFDAMFIDLFPNFIEKFNSLLEDNEQIILKEKGVLNTELRIYALIRLGVDDSQKIADFLGYSVNTIYNYRTKMKNKAKAPREEFERKVGMIGAFT